MLLLLLCWQAPAAPVLAAGMCYLFWCWPAGSLPARLPPHLPALPPHLMPALPSLLPRSDLRKNHGKEEARARDLFYALWIPDLFMERVEVGAQRAQRAQHGV